MRNKLFEKWVEKYFDGLSPFTLYQFCLTASDCIDADIIYRAKADDFVYRTLYNLFLQGKNPWHIKFRSMEQFFMDQLERCEYISTPAVLY